MRLNFLLKSAIFALMVACALVLAQNPAKQRAEADRAAIQRLHEEDVRATLSGKAGDFARLWSNDAVRMEPDRPAEIGSAAIFARDKREEKEAAAAQAQTLSYQPDIRDLQIRDGWAFEWGYFDASFKTSATAKPQSMRGKFLRILERQPDGSWRFARVMWNTVK